MAISILLTGTLALLTFTGWKRIILPSMIASLVDTPYRYCYTSTLWRYAGGASAYCFIFFTLVWGSAFLLSNILGVLFTPAGLSNTNWQAVSLPMLVLGIYGLCSLPVLRRLTLYLHSTVMRHLFFPIIPSSVEDVAISQLLRDTEVSPSDDSEELRELRVPDTEVEREEIQRQIHSMVVLYEKLAKLFNEDPNKPIKMWLYGEEWSLIHHLYQSVLNQLQQHPTTLTPELLNTLQLCQYYCCHLLVRYWFSTAFTDDQRQSRYSEIKAA